MKAAVITNGDFPRAPDAFAFAETAIENIVGAHITLYPVTFASVCLVAALDKELSDIIIAFAGDETMGERQIHLHPVPVTRTVIVKSDPRT